MAAVIEGAPTRTAQPNGSLPWLVAGFGLAALYLPTYWGAMQGIWRSEDMGHGPIILAVLAWLFWGVRRNIAEAAASSSGSWTGWPLLAAGLALHFLGRALGISSIEFGSHLFVVPAVLLLLAGPRALRAAWFPLIYLVFLIPLPASFVDAVTGPLKNWISAIVVDLLYAVGYPIARTGVMITIGQYQMLVADACSGLHSMFSLAALGTLFMYIMRRKSVAHNAVMLASILPIAFVSNIVRVIVLVLVTYHLGDEAGQGFLHGAAGMVLMLAALLFFFLLDTLLALLLRPRVARVGGS